MTWREVSDGCQANGQDDSRFGSWGKINPTRDTRFPEYEGESQQGPISVDSLDLLYCCQMRSLRLRTIMRHVGENSVPQSRTKFSIHF